MTRRRAFGLFWLALALGGCAELAPLLSVPPGSPPPVARSEPSPQKPILLPGRVLVLPVPSGEPNRPMVESVSRLVAQAFHDRWGNVIPFDSYMKVAQGVIVQPQELGLRLSLMKRPEGPDVRWLLERLQIQTVVLVDVYDLEQRWTRTGKATRVGVDATALHLPSGDMLWRARYRPEIEGRPGRAVSTSVELAVHQLVQAIHGEKDGPIQSQWWLWQR